MDHGSQRDFTTTFLSIILFIVFIIFIAASVAGIISKLALIWRNLSHGLLFAFWGRERNIRQEEVLQHLRNIHPVVAHHLHAIISQGKGKSKAREKHQPAGSR
jgi:hypothetical protein